MQSILWQYSDYDLKLPLYRDAATISVQRFFYYKEHTKMKYTIHGFSQYAALKFKKTIVVKVSGKEKEKEIKIDSTDLLILRWFVDFYPKMMKFEIDGVQYAWVQYKKILQDLPLLDIKKQALSDRLNKLCEFKILTHKTIKEQGTFSYYGFGEMYGTLIDTECSQLPKGEYSDTEGVCSQLPKGEYSTKEQIDKSIKDDSIKNKNNIIDENFEKLWKMLPSNKNDRKSKVTKKRKKELYEMGESAIKAITLYLNTQNSSYYHARHNILNELIDNYIDNEMPTNKNNNGGNHTNGVEEGDTNDYQRNGNSESGSNAKRRWQTV